jgi:hypothetical protein
VSDLVKVSKQKKEDIISLSLFDDKSVKDFEKKLGSLELNKNKKKLKFQVNEIQVLIIN